MTSWNGRQFGKYILHNEVGRGGMARVFRATDTTLQRTVALKILAPQLASDPESSQRFEREAITAGNLHHPSIVTIFDVGEAEGLPYIAMEYIAGRSLQAVIDEQGALGLGYAVALLMPVAEALDYAHSQQAVHRDVKPHNILLNADGRVLLTDFGIAQAPVVNEKRLTRAGMFMGTPEYIAPEQASAQLVDGRSDLYSLGIVAFEVITGQVPFTGTVPELLVAHTYTPPPAITSLVPGLPAAFDKVFERALAKQPSERPPSAVAFIDALRTLSSRVGITIPSKDELKGLAVPAGSSAGKATVAINALPALQRQSDPSAQTDVGAIQPQARPATPVPQPVPRPSNPNPTARVAPSAQPRPQAQPQAAQSQSRPRPHAASNSNAARPRMRTRPVLRTATTSDPLKVIYPVAIIITLAVLGIVFWQRMGQGTRGFVSLPTATQTSSLSGPFVPESTRIPTAIPTNTPEPTPTDAPTEQPSATPEPSATVPSPIPTRTRIPTRTVPPTRTTAPTTVVPSATPVVPTDVPATPTDVPPPTPTNGPTEQPTQDLPTVTNTGVEPTVVYPLPRPEPSPIS
ncbi:serine/threonine-protein kinase [Herpetosiphon giganteus]|uniref:serine/threonine-protein kinase n=1 Tax=Herpetosiphon giganteus TaxID=2029754 RepID=UPI00195C071B|nr:serine/threonine-protein kinase [Herpetosiphon giganteus]MBM7842960.1 serine/threonine-protein kinase [Herpetosiphon giganteus]